MDRLEPLHIGLAVVIGVSFVGFFVGVSPTERQTSPLRSDAPVDAPAAGIAVAPSYGDLMAGQRSDDNWAATQAKLYEGLDEAEGGNVAAAVAARAERRAYDGAPPTIPHAVQQGTASECNACHDLGLQVRDGTARMRPHDSYLSCTQCHVVMEAPMPADSWLAGGPWSVRNSFDGLDSPTGGDRAWSIAPPEVPHQTFMRERCDSCHGPAGSSPMKSTHPERQSCEQCHAGSADEDLRPGSNHLVKAAM